MKLKDICSLEEKMTNLVQLLSQVWLFATPWITAHQASCPSPSPGAYSNSRPLSRWCHPAISSCPPLFLLHPIPSSIRVPSNESTLHMRWPEDWSFSFSISPSNEDSGLFSFRIDWFDLVAIQGALKSLLQYHSWKASIQCSAFFMAQLSHSYMTTGKTTALWSLLLPLEPLKRRGPP